MKLSNLLDLTQNDYQILIKKPSINFQDFQITIQFLKNFQVYKIHDFNQFKLITKKINKWKLNYKNLILFRSLKILIEIRISLL